MSQTCDTYTLNTYKCHRLVTLKRFDCKSVYVSQTCDTYTFKPYKCHRLVTLKRCDCKHVYVHIVITPLFSYALSAIGIILFFDTSLVSYHGLVTILIILHGFVSIAIKSIITSTIVLNVAIRLTCRIVGSYLGVVIFVFCGIASIDYLNFP